MTGKRRAAPAGRKRKGQIQPENTTAEPSVVPTQAAAGWMTPLATLPTLAVWLGRR